MDSSPSTVDEHRSCRSMHDDTGDDTACHCNRWVSRAYLDVLREHIIPNLGRFYAVADAGADSSRDAQTTGQGARKWRLVAGARESHASIALVCSDWAASQRQAETGVLQVRLWDERQVRSLASYLRRRPRVTWLWLQSPQPELACTPGMVAAVGDLLYGSTVGAAGGEEPLGEDNGATVNEHGADVAAPGDLHEGGGGGGEARRHGGGPPSAVREGGGSGACNQPPDCSALPRSLRCLEADGRTAVPLLLLAAAADLPYLETLSMSQMPAVWTFEEGSLPWPPHAAAHLAQMLPPELSSQVVDPGLYRLMYGAAVERRFQSYWSSYDGALAALLLRRGGQLREVALEAPARSVGLRAPELLMASGGRGVLESLRLHGFGLRREPHQPPRVPLERAGLRLAAALAAAGKPPQRPMPSPPPLPPQQPGQEQGGSSLGGGGGTEVSCCGGSNTCSGRAHVSSPFGCSTAAGCGFYTAGGSSGPGCSDLSLSPVCYSPSYNGCCHLTRLEILACGVEPLYAGVLEGLTGLRHLSLRDSSLTWRDRPPDLRSMGQLVSLDLRRCDWLTQRGSPWDEQLLLPTSLESLDLIGFSSLTSADLSPAEHLTGLAELADITLHPDPADTSEPLLKPPYSRLAALTCMQHNVRMYVGREKLLRRQSGRGVGCSCLEDSDDEEEDDGEEWDGGDGGASRPNRGVDGGSSSDGSVWRRAATSQRRRRLREAQERYGERAGRGDLCGDSCSNSPRSHGFKSGGGGGGSKSEDSSGSTSGGGSDNSGGGGDNSGGFSGESGSTSGGEGLARRAALAVLPASREPPLVSLTLYGVMPQYVSDLFSSLPLLTRLVFGGGKEGHHGGGGAAVDSDSDDDDNGGVGVLVLRAGELPRLRELDLRLGLLGYGNLGLGPASSLTRLAVDNIEYVDVRYIELPPSLQHFSLTAWFGLPELYHLAEGPLQEGSLAQLAQLVRQQDHAVGRQVGQQLQQTSGRGLMDSALAAAAATRMRRRAAAGAAAGDDGGGSGGGSDVDTYNGGEGDYEDDDEGNEMYSDSAGGGPLAAAATASGGLLGLGAEFEDDFSALSWPSPNVIRDLEAEVERQLVCRLLPPLRQLTVLHINWDVVTHGPLQLPTRGSCRANGISHAPNSHSKGESGGGGSSRSSGGSGGTSTVLRWRFPYLPLLEELNIPCMQELPEEDLARLAASCPQLRGVTHCNGSRRAVRGPEGGWIRRCTGA